MRIRFLGGADKVGSLGMILEVDGVRLLFDYGLTPSKPPEYPLPSPPVDATFLTHAHLDHSGMLPFIAGRYSSPIYATFPTIPVTNLLLNDTIKVCGIEGYACPYTQEDVDVTTHRMIPVEYGSKIGVDSVDVEVFSSGHIPGSAMYRVNGEERLLFTGDIQTIDTNLLSGCEIPKTDILVIEATYAGREHPPREEVTGEFLDTIEEINGRGGVAIVPAFAVGRTQELMLILHKKGYEVWLDGMGVTVTKMYLRYSKYLKNPQRLKKALKSFNIVKKKSDRKKALKGDVILTTSGMLDGGPVLHYINALRNDARSGILLTGYQVDGTNGRMLLDTGIIDLYGVRSEVNAEVKFFDFSAHAGHSELLEFIYKTGASTVVLCHGDNREALKKDLADVDVIIPKNDEYVKLTS